MTATSPETIQEIDRKIAKGKADARRWPVSPGKQTAEFWEGRRLDAQAERLIEQMEGGVIAPPDAGR